MFGFVFAPCTLSSLNAATHSGLDSDGGGAGRNWSALFRMNGRTDATHGVCGARYGGVNRHTPGPGASVGNDDVDAIGVWSPSPSRSAISFAAARAPYRMPTTLDWSSGIAASASWCSASRVAAWAGK